MLPGRLGYEEEGGGRSPTDDVLSRRELQGDSGVRVTILSFLVGVASREGLPFLPEFNTAIVHKVSAFTLRDFTHTPQGHLSCRS